MKRTWKPNLLIALCLLSYAHSAFAQSTLNHMRASVLQSEASILNTFHDKEQLGTSEAHADMFLSAVELIYGYRVVGNRSASLVKRGGGLLLLVNGVATAAISLAGKEPTLIPLVTMGMAEVGIYPPPKFKSSQYSVRYHDLGIDNKDAFVIGMVEGGAGAMGTLYLKHKNFPKIRFASLAVMFDGFITALAGNNDIKEDPRLLPLLTYFVDKVASQPPLINGLNVAADALHSKALQLEGSSAAPPASTPLGLPAR